MVVEVVNVVVNERLIDMWQSLLKPESQAGDEIRLMAKEVFEFVGKVEDQCARMIAPNGEFVDIRLLYTTNRRLRAVTEWLHPLETQSLRTCMR